MSRPRFLTEFAPTTHRRRITPFSRGPVTGQIGDALHVAAERRPNQLIITDRAADIDPGAPLTRTYAQWAKLVDEATGWLHALGVRPWDRVAVIKANHFDIAVLAAAAARIGAVPALLSGAYGPDIVRVLLSRLEKPYVITDGAHLRSAGLDAEAVRELTARTVCTTAQPGRPDVVDLNSLRGATVAAPRLRRPDEPMIATHTSGTTGIPKLVVHSAISELGAAIIESERWPVVGLRPSDVWAYCEPYWHERQTHQMLSMATVTQRMLMLSEPKNLPKLKNLLLKHRPTLVEALPNIYLYWEELARDPDQPFASVREYVNSFDAIHTRTIRTFLDASDSRMPIWLQAWSQSENGTILIRPYLRRNVRRRGHRPPPTQMFGWTVPGFGRVRIVDPATRRKVGRGKVGLIEIKQPGRCLTYIGEHDRHTRKRDGDWWNTGDLGTLNRVGALRFVDREIDRIPSGSAVELEDVLLDRLTKLSEVIVLPVADGAPVPVYSTHDELPVAPDEWRSAAVGLPVLADPIHIKWEEFPRTGTWKVQRVELRGRLLPDTRTLGTGDWT
ncbi:AMP-binding protein [Streptomyces sp. NPDC058000]|uniref:AMP-binding protein n=1 Tax=Streptomyces sp. NPDC058000 TaxID=3346299 RepID=UPI0036E3DEFF